MTESARELMKEMGFTKIDVTSNHENSFKLQQRIVAVGCEKEEMLKEKHFVSDRSVIDPLIFTQMYVSVEKV